MCASTCTRKYNTLNSRLTSADEEAYEMWVLYRKHSKMLFIHLSAQQKRHLTIYTFSDTLFAFVRFGFIYKIFFSLICRQVAIEATEAMAIVDKLPTSIASGVECDNFIMIWRNFFHFFPTDTSANNILTASSFIERMNEPTIRLNVSVCYTLAINDTIQQYK